MSSEESVDDQAQGEDSVQASIDNKKLKLAMKKRKSNYNAIIKRNKHKRTDGTDVDSYMKLKIEEISDQNGKSPTNKFDNRMSSVGNLPDINLLPKFRTSLQADERLSELPSNDNERKDSEEQKINGGPKDSTGGSGENKNKVRKDRFGTRISRGQKHKVTFKDQVGKGKVAKVYYVESYKKYNVETSTNTCS